MAYREFRFDPEAIQDRVKECLEVAKAEGRPDFEAFGARIFAEYLRDAPEKYRVFGPYWPALKEVLIKHGRAIGSPVFPEIAKAYRGANDTETLVMAEAFRDYYFDHYFVGANSFLLDEDDDEEWVLIDHAYEHYYDDEEY